MQVAHARGVSIRLHAHMLMEPDVARQASDQARDSYVAAAWFHVRAPPLPVLAQGGCNVGGCRQLPCRCCRAMHGADVAGGRPEEGWPESLHDALTGLHVSCTHI